MDFKEIFEKQLDEAKSVEEYLDRLSNDALKYAVVLKGVNISGLITIVDILIKSKELTQRKTFLNKVKKSLLEAENMKNKIDEKLSTTYAVIEDIKKWEQQ